MKMIQTLGYRVGICNVWHPRFNQCINTGSALIVCFVSSQNFYKSEINKEEMYIRYIHKLCDMHLQAENYTGTAESVTRGHEQNV